MNILISPAKNGKFTWAFVAANGKQTANNETFASRASATRAAKAVVTSVALMLGVDTDSFMFATSRTSGPKATSDRTATGGYTHLVVRFHG